MEVVHVGLKERSYYLYIDKGLIKKIGDRLNEMEIDKKVAVITNPLVNNLYGHYLEDSLKSADFNIHFIDIPDGEEYKTLETAVKIYDSLINFKMERQSFLIALGGGVIGDITGFVAATYLRGVPYVQIPTTLLAQVDSSIGGKTAVNHPKGKNLIGAFYQPRSVFIDIDTLKTLPREEVLCGIAEIIKYGVIRDRDFFEYLEGNIERLINLDEEVTTYSIKRSCEIKAEVVSRDERESGLRGILNFGHTIGHAVESLTDYRGYRHGEAVAIGMAYASRLSLKSGLCSSEDYERVVNLIKAADLPTAISGLDADAIIDSLYLDKKVKEEKIRFILLNGIGSVEMHGDITNELIRKVLTN
jgi:3-dehydroquinate synthase